MEFITNKTALDILCERERDCIIRQILKEINPKHALIIRLRYWENMKYSQIAQIIDSTSGSVGGTIAYIQQKLRKKVEGIR